MGAGGAGLSEPPVLSVGLCLKNWSNLVVFPPFSSPPYSSPPYSSHPFSFSPAPPLYFTSLPSPFSLAPPPLGGVFPPAPFSLESGPSWPEDSGSCPGSSWREARTWLQTLAGRRFPYSARRGTFLSCTFLNSLKSSTSWGDISRTPFHHMPLSPEPATCCRL